MARFACTRVFSLAVCFLVPGVWACSQEALEGPIRVGASMQDITPKQSDLALSTDTIRDHLFARVIVVDNGRTCAVLGGLDLAVAPNEMMALALPRMVAATGCPVANILISATHTHSPNTGGRSVQTSEMVAGALVKAATEAKAKLAPATVGYGKTNVDLNVNRDLYNSKLEWRQQPNVDGPSDKTLSVVEFIGADRVPIGVYVNYAMHPINFYLSGVVSADFPGEASRTLEAMFDHHTVAIFSQGTSGDQNPMLKERQLTPYLHGAAPVAETIGEAPVVTAANFNPANAQSTLAAVPAENMAGYRKGIERIGADVTMMGTLIAERALYVMRNDIKPVGTARIWGGQESFKCPGRDRLDVDNPIRENGTPPYKDGVDVKLKVGLLRIGDINFASVDGEVYTNIGLKLKAASPANKVIITTLANGFANSGYIYSDDAFSHLSFQVISSRLKPGCAEGKIAGAALDLMHKSGE